MGKKRRLNSTKAKFRTKHANHPRSRLLSANAAIETPAVVEAPIIVEAAQTEAVLTAAVEESVVEVAPEVVVPVKRARRTTKKRTKRHTS
tara:strand:- start:2783 stop:3052 length:270 start_codon:yes stop_codon:yes gene_type:complete